MRIANAFFRLAGNPVEAIVRTDSWRRWEVDSFRLLHAPDFPATLGADDLPCVATLPGGPLAAHLDAGTLTPPMLASAARELRRAHALHSDYFRGGWSHGDPHTGNIIFDPATGRARLIDFEMRHLPILTADARHADDLLILLQDVCGRCPAGAWLPLATAFLSAYDRPAIAALLHEKMHIPGGFGRLWWGVRTTWMQRSELERRVGELRFEM